MAIAIQLEPATIAALDAIVAKGRIKSRDEAIRTALQIVEANDPDEWDPLSSSEIAGIERGLADAEAGRLIPVEQVMEELERRHAAGL
jgi:predicted transcriptional regulator